MNNRGYSCYSIACPLLPLAGWVLLCLAASGTAVFVSTDGWYEALEKPALNPPAWLFAPVWTTLYIMMGLSAWLVWRKGGWKIQGRPLGWFLLQMALNAIWTPVFFGLHWIGPAFVEISILWMVLLWTIVLFFRTGILAGLLLVPYFLWVSFAAYLNFALWRLNA